MAIYYCNSITRVIIKRYPTLRRWLTISLSVNISCLLHRIKSLFLILKVPDSWIWWFAHIKICFVLNRKSATSFTFSHTTVTSHTMFRCQTLTSIFFWTVDTPLMQLHLTKISCSCDISSRFHGRTAHTFVLWKLSMN